jgi:chromosome segregation protein
VLHADPMGRRAFIEEAAGVLKHRKRKEKALRKLDAMQANLARVTDLTGELRRQLKPLGRQAQVARRAAVIQADLRDARLRLLADDLMTLREALRAEVADEAALKERKDAVESQLAAAVQREARLEEQVRALTPRVNDAQATWYALSQLTERVRGTIGLAEQRHRHAVGQPAEERRGRDPEDMEREAARIREQEAELTEALDAAERALEDTVSHRAELERRLAEEETRLRVAARAIADRREGLARLNGQVNAARSKAGSAEAEIGRLAAARDEARDRAESAQAEYEELRAQVEGLDADDSELEARFEAARSAQAAAEEEFSAAREAATTAERRRAAVAARRDALAPSLRRKDGTGALLARAGAADGLAGVLGSAATLLRVAPGYEVPVAAALGVAADAVAVTGPAAAAEALRLLRKEDGGRAALILASAPGADSAEPAALGAPTDPRGVPGPAGPGAPAGPAEAPGPADVPGPAGAAEVPGPAAPGAPEVPAAAVFPGQTAGDRTASGAGRGAEDDRDPRRRPEHDPAGGRPAGAGVSAASSADGPHVVADADEDGTPEQGTGRSPGDVAEGGAAAVPGQAAGTRAGPGGGPQPVGRSDDRTAQGHGRVPAPGPRPEGDDRTAPGREVAAGLPGRGGHGGSAVSAAAYGSGSYPDRRTSDAFAQERSEPRSVPRPAGLALPAQARHAAELVAADGGLLPAVRRLLHGIVVVPTLEDAEALVGRHPELTAVTAEGDVLAAHLAQGGSAKAPSVLEVQAQVDEASAELERLAGECAELADRQQAAKERRAAAAREVDELGQRRRAAEKAKSSVAQQLGRYGGQARAAVGEADRAAAAVVRAQESLAAAREEFEELSCRLSEAQEEPGEEEPDTYARDRLAADGANARQTEMEARLQVRTHEERVKSLAGRADGLDRAARVERETRARAERRRARLAYEASVAAAVVAGARGLLECVQVSLGRAEAERVAAERARAEREAELGLERRRGRELKSELDRLTGDVHKGEVLGAEKRLRIEQLEAKALEEHGMEPAGLVAEYGPELPVPPSPPAEGEVLPDDPEHPRNQPVPYVRAEQEKRLKAAEKAYAQLGKVNPLALEEFAALEERHKFLTEQLEDLRKTRTDLLQVIKDVDERVEQVFTAAFHDTAREFEGVFSRLFPGGEGRLLLTDPDNMLTTGVEVEARPPGKKVKRLSLLSGGERSLTAVAMLVSIFKARPSPFYVMDEVEAALDDTNLQRLIRIMEELQESSQLIVITHQKRTMEVADALYGVSMQGDGVSKVISQRLRDGKRATVQAV